MVRPFSVMVAPNGARRGKADHPNLPITETEIVEAVAEAHEAGAHAAHVHVRNDAGEHVLDAERYLSLIAALRARCGDDLLIQITTEAVGRYSPAEQRAVVRAVRPDHVSIAYRELFAESAEAADNSNFLEEMTAGGTAIQWIVYDTRDLDALAAMLADNPHRQGDAILFVLGRYTKGQQSHPADLLPFLAAYRAHPSFAESRWSACAFGAAETRCLIAALLLGGDVRVGFENSLWHADGSLAASNAERVREIVARARALGLAPAEQASSSGP